MAMFSMFIGELQHLQQVQHDAGDGSRGGDAARLQRKLWRTEIGLAVIALGAVAMFLDAATSLSGFTG
ncbi:hypothetical protein UB46_12200 [Burkholderiaceae bacterium 16]|nr:hypothetical protein UB46_12200 [Burkholderiaceae bacterium 16]